MITVQGFLISPFVNQEQAFRIFCREEIIVADAALDSADSGGDTAILHFLDIFPGVPVFSGIPDVND